MSTPVSSPSTIYSTASTANNVVQNTQKYTVLLTGKLYGATKTAASIFFKKIYSAATFSTEKANYAFSNLSKKNPNLFSIVLITSVFAVVIANVIKKKDSQRDGACGGWNFRDYLPTWLTRSAPAEEPMRRHPWDYANR